MFVRRLGMGDTPIANPKFAKAAAYASLAADVVIALGGAFALWRAFNKKKG